MCIPERLKVSDYAECLLVLNESFSHKEVSEEKPHQADFETALPIMWTREHDYMSRHFAVKENGKIQALLGLYPLTTVIAGEKVLMGTIGNVATLPEGRGKGYMKQLMETALDEAERLGLVAARLGGLRSRYNRYGFDHAGVLYCCELTRRNVKEYGIFPELQFEPLKKDDKQSIAFARSLQESAPMYVIRETDLDFYCTLCAWKNHPLLAKDSSGRLAGYLSVSPDGSSVAEWGCLPELSSTDLLAAYMAAHPELKAVTYKVMPYDNEALQSSFRHCESWIAEIPSMFHVFRWDELLRPLMKLATKTRGLPDGELTAEIAGWGNLHLQVKDDRVVAEKTEHPGEIKLSHLDATNFFFGNLPAIHALPGNRAENAWFPLPLSWNGQDRV